MERDGSTILPAGGAFAQCGHTPEHCSLASSANLSLSRKAGSRFLAGFLAVSQRTLLRLQGPGHGHARACVCCCASLSRALAEWSHTLLRVELSFDYVSGDTPIAKWRTHLLASGDLLRVARKSDSLRFRWVYRIRRDRKPSRLSCLACLDTRPFGALFRLIRLPGLETASRQIQGGSGPAVRRHYLLPGLHCLLSDVNVTGESLYVDAALSTIVQVKLFAPEAPL